MEVIGKQLVKKFIKKHTDCKQQILVQILELEENSYKSLKDLGEKSSNRVRKVYAIFMFDLKGGNYKMICRIDFVEQDVLIIKLCTHEEYNKLDLRKL